jgi:hypothetical protein
LKILALDFDGVIVDSVLDSLFIGHNAYLRLYGPGKKKYFGGELNYLLSKIGKRLKSSTRKK